MILDCHGMTIDDALTEFHIALGQVLLSSDRLEIITGQGPIQKTILEELKKLEINYLIEAYNMGKIIITEDQL